MSVKVYVPLDAAARSIGADATARAIAEQASARGLEITLVRNGTRGLIWLEPLVELGISDLSLSSYAYFVENADEDHLRNAALAAHELGLPMGVLEVGAAACLDVPGLCLGDVICVGRRDVKNVTATVEESVFGRG